jgi:hypothetical protein
MAELAVAALVRGSSVRAAAEEVGISRRVLVTWMT